MKRSISKVNEFIYISYAAFFLTILSIINKEICQTNLVDTLITFESIHVGGASSSYSLWTFDLGFFWQKEKEKSVLKKKVKNHKRVVKL